MSRRLTRGTFRAPSRFSSRSPALTLWSTGFPKGSMENFSIIKRPLITERATNLKAQSNQYVFRVAPHATKRDIKAAVEQLFKVTVLGVNTMQVSGKFRRMGNAPGAYRPTWKKAIVKLPAGQEIKILDEGQ